MRDENENTERSCGDSGAGPVAGIINGVEKIIETHISRVYITEKFAYKQKKPVNFGFVDYTTLQKRIFFAKKELSLNRRACSGVYLDLAELRQKKNKIFIGFKGGRLIDVLVRMKRVENKNFLDNILKNDDNGGFANEKTLKKIAKKIYLFHTTARTSKRISKFGDKKIYKANWDDNFLIIKDEKEKNEKEKRGGTDLFFALQKKISVPHSADRVAASYSSFLSSALFSEFTHLRKEGGFIRDVHGDLRMEHIAVLDARRISGICLMDCVEFDERYRCQDIYLDIAFLLMDFEFNGYFYESVLFFGFYKECFNYLKFIAPFGKYEPSVIPFFKSYRAVVRTKISLLHSGEDTRAKARRYFNLAAFYLALAANKVVILNCGLSGSGKSLLSSFLSRYFYAPVFSTDKIRQNLFGEADKPVKYSAEANSKVYEAMFEEGLKEFENKAGAEDGRHVDGGDGSGFITRGSLDGRYGGVIFDATFLKRSQRAKIINSFFNKKNCIFIFVYSKIYEGKEEIVLKRLKGRFCGSGAKENYEAAVAEAKSVEAGGFTGRTGDGGAKRGSLTADYSEADEAVYFNQKKFFEEPSESEIKRFTETFPISSSIFVQIDASLELKDRFNELMKNIVEKY